METQYKSVPKSKALLITMLSDICLFARHHHSYYFDAVDDIGSFCIDTVMDTTAHVMACYLSQHINDSVETEAFMPILTVINFKDEEVEPWISNMVESYCEHI